MRNYIDTIEKATLTESYVRVMPRDLFNDANLLKCYGALYIALENNNRLDVEMDHHGDTFEIEQTEDGGTSISNIVVSLRGEPMTLERPMNSRNPYPLVWVTEDWDYINIFNDNGTLSAEFLEKVSRDSEYGLHEGRTVYKGNRSKQGNRYMKNTEYKIPTDAIAIPADEAPEHIAQFEGDKPDVYNSDGTTTEVWDNGDGSGFIRQTDPSGTVEHFFYD